MIDNPLWLAPALALLLGYLFGSVPFGLVLTRAAGAGDLRAIGSGNIGATNVLRTGRKGLAVATLLLGCAVGALSGRGPRDDDAPSRARGACWPLLSHLAQISRRKGGRDAIRNRSGFRLDLHVCVCHRLAHHGWSVAHIIARWNQFGARTSCRGRLAGRDTGYVSVCRPSCAGRVETPQQYRAAHSAGGTAYRQRER